MQFLNDITDEKGVPRTPAEEAMVALVDASKSWTIGTASWILQYGEYKEGKHHHNFDVQTGIMPESEVKKIQHLGTGMYEKKLFRIMVLAVNKLAQSYKSDTCAECLKSQVITTSI